MEEESGGESVRLGYGVDGIVGVKGCRVKGGELEVGAEEGADGGVWGVGYVGYVGWGVFLFFFTGHRQPSTRTTPTFDSDLQPRLPTPTTRARGY